MKVHSVVAVTDETIKTRETVCVCAECFGENVFNLSTNCKWDDQNMTKHAQEQSNAIEQDLGGNITSNTENDKFIEDESKDLKVAIDDFVILEYDKKYYIGKIEPIDEDDGELEVTCMESCGTVEGRYRWPKNEDKIWIPHHDVITKINEPQATGKSKRMFTVDTEALALLQN